MESGKARNITWQVADELLTPIVGWQPSLLDDIHKVSHEKTRFIAKIGNWENMSDSEIFESITLGQYISGQIYIITDLSHIDNLGVFKSDKKDLHAFASEYSNLYSECLFNGDVYFISPEKKTLLTFQHDGNWILLKLPFYKR